MSCYSTSGGSHKEHISTDFAVPTGSPEKSMHAPLGHSDPTDHFIRPVPGFETEYESAYCHADSDIDKMLHSVLPSKDPYNEIKLVLKSLIDEKFEVEMATNMLHKIQEKEKFSHEFDDMYNHFQSMKECKHLDPALHHLVDEFLRCVDSLRAKEAAVVAAAAESTA